MSKAKPKTKTETVREMLAGEKPEVFNLTAPETSKPDPELEPEPIKPAPAPVQAKSAPTETITNKSEAIRRALAEGIEKPQEAVTWIKNTFGLDVSTGTFSTTKALIKKKASGPTTIVSSGQSGRPKLHMTAPATVRTSLNTSTSSSTLDLVKSVKVLIDQHGADAVLQAVNIFAD